MTFRDHFSGHAGAYASARPLYPDSMYEWLAAQCAQRALAWDCATGNGQAAVALARRFARVNATDASAEQIANAQPAGNVEYRTATAETSGLAAASVDLVAVAQALHWFDVDAFHAEAKRVLKPGGVIAEWGYQLTRVAPDIDRIMEVFDRDIVGVHWPPERRHIDAAYTDLPFPFERIEAPAFDMRVDWSREQFLAYIGTWSAVQRYRKEKGHDPLAWLENELAAFWSADEIRAVGWPLFLRVGRQSL